MDKKFNIFGWPVFKGKIHSEDSDDKIYSSQTTNEFWITYRNDLTAIQVSFYKQETAEGFTVIKDIEGEVACSLIDIAATACGVLPSEVMKEQSLNFMLYMLASPTKTANLSSLKFHLSTEAEIINSCGLYCDIR